MHLPGMWNRIESLKLGGRRSTEPLSARDIRRRERSGIPVGNEVVGKPLLLTANMSYSVSQGGLERRAFVEQ